MRSISDRGVVPLQCLCQRVNVPGMVVVVANESMARNRHALKGTTDLVKYCTSRCARILWVQGNKQKVVAAVLRGRLGDAFDARVPVGHSRVELEISFGKAFGKIRFDSGR